jgi:hypothetical protein
VTSDDPDRQAGERLRLALELYEAGEQMMRARLRREHPDASDDEIEARLVAWLRDRPGATYGDGDGHPVPFPPPRR